MSHAHLPVALFAMAPEHFPGLFPPPLLERLGQLARIDASLVSPGLDDPAVAARLAEAEILVTGWGCPPLSEDVLAAAPRLHTVLHAAGSVRGMLTEACWERGLVVCNAVAANALPVAEYTLSAILLAGTGAFTLRERYRVDPRYPSTAELAGLGNNGRRVGIIGASRVGRRVLELLRPFDLEVALHDPYVDDAEAARLGARPVPLDDLLRGSDIVSVHAPDNAETHHMLDRARLALIPDGGVLINTSRGRLIDQVALVEELAAGRISAVLDVTDPEPLPADSPLHHLPNVFLTPHIAGSVGNELERMGRTVVEELERIAGGLPPLYQVHRAGLAQAA
ncbi:hydroxyacid dehydrogenase [Streptomyces sp. NPDC096311]|uniref:hydroxyacid dehydrogenase n=1 Tax=Streptomyces sp. NPDC096311 TaxID=3366083 RepID=UPI0038214398